MRSEEVLEEFRAAEAILSGHFILSSGLHSPTYLQCARVLMDAKRAARLCAALAEKVEAQFPAGSFDMVVSPAMGGVVVGYEMGRQLDVPSVFCERSDGVFALRRGFSLEKGARVLLVEDVVTTGKSSIEAMECVNAHGADVLALACLVNRISGETSLNFPVFSLLELQVPAYAPDQVPSDLASIPPVKPGSRWLNATANA